MKLREVLENIDKSEKNSSWINLEEFAYYFGLNFYLDDRKNERLKSYFFKNWYCTDQYVGGRAYYFDDKIVCISYQQSRGDSKHFEWVSKYNHDQVKNYLLSLLFDEDNEEIDICDLEIEVGDGYKVEYNSQFLTHDVIFEPTHQEVKIIDKNDEHFQKNENFQKVKIQFFNGDEKIVNTNEILIPYNTKK